MKSFELPYMCESCQNLKTYGYYSNLNLLVSCKKGDWNFYTECDKYEKLDIGKTSTNGMPSIISLADDVEEES